RGAEWLRRVSLSMWEVPGGGGEARGDGQRPARRSGGVGSGVPGPGLPQRVCAEPSGSGAGGALLDPASGQPDPVADPDGPDRAALAAGGGLLRAGQPHPGGAFHEGQRKIEVMRQYLDRAAASGRSQVAAIGWAQEYAQVASARTWHTETGWPQFAFG